jgi:hypothetical protein
MKLSLFMRVKTTIIKSLVYLIIQVSVLAQVQNNSTNSNDSTFKCYCQKIVKEYCIEYGVPELQKMEFEDNDFEVRIWTSVSNGRDAVFIKNENNTMSIYYLDGLTNTFDRLLDLVGLSTQEIDLMDSSSIDTKRLWDGLMENDILILPDEEDISDSYVVLDGSLYIVEIGNNLGYRCYHYSNPDLYEVDGAKKMVRIIEILNNEIISKY